ncbi:MAG: hypothetical protein ACE5JP_15650 [Candidatus Bipolaricaulia bacterium]
MSDFVLLVLGAIGISLLVLGAIGIVVGNTVWEGTDRADIVSGMGLIGMIVGSLLVAGIFIL